MIDKIIIISIICIFILAFSYPIIRLIGKAWYKSYFEEINSLKFKNLNKRRIK